MPQVIEAVDGGILARVETDEMVFEVTFDELRVNDVTVHFRRDGQKVGSIYNDDGTERTMARLEVAGEDFIGVRVPKSFVADLLDAAEERGCVTEGRSTAEKYRLRVLQDEDEGEGA